MYKNRGLHHKVLERRPLLVMHTYKLWPHPYLHAWVKSVGKHVHRRWCLISVLFPPTRSLSMQAAPQGAFCSNGAEFI
jgi:hypothetical protein